MPIHHPARCTPRKIVALAIASTLLATIPLQAGAQPASKTSSEAPRGHWLRDKAVDGVERLVTPGIDRKQAEADDIARYDQGDVPHYAVALERRVTPSTFGTWDTVAKDQRRWRLRIASPGANSINLGFTRYLLPEGAELRVLDAKGGQPYRAFTAADNEAHGQLWTPLVFGNEVMLELRVPAAKAADLQLELSWINHGYRLPGQHPDFQKSGACNVDTACPAGDAWRDQIQSSAVISTRGIKFCSAALINNTAKDKKPYLLTAFHCQVTDAFAPTLVTYWNFQNSTCRTPGSAESGQPGDGQLTQFNTGALVRAAREASDFTLLELDDSVDPYFEPFWSGWNRSTGDVASAVTIHHPNTEEKRISFENAPTTTTSYLENDIPGDGTHIRIADWDLGTTEGGSSGAPLYDPQGRIIGQLHGGFAACGNDFPDWYGRLSSSWTGGGTDATRLSNWLDPGDTGLVTLAGIGAAPFVLTLDPESAAVCASSAPLAVGVNVELLDLSIVAPIDLALVGLPANAASAFADSPVPAPGNTTLTLSNLDLVAPGDYALKVTGSAGTHQDSVNFALSIHDAAPGTPMLSTPAADALGVAITPLLSWEASEQAHTYLVEVDDDADFGSPEFSATVRGTSALATGLASGTRYHWRVTAENSCQAGTASAPRSFTTVFEYCATPNLAIPNARPTGVSSTLAVPAGVTLVDLDLALDVSHSWVGDLVVSLSKDGGGPNQVLVDRPGRGTSGGGCNGDDMDIVLDDEGATEVETSCTSGYGLTPAYIDDVHYRPNDSLAIFDGADRGGTWRLTISDNSAGDSGVLNRWCLLFAGNAVASSIDAQADAYGLDEDTSLTVAAPGVLGNDVATGATPRATVLAQPANGEVSLAANGGFTYTPHANFCGTDNFTYTATSDAATDTAGVTLTLACINDGPIAGTLPKVSVPPGVVASIATAGGFSDPDEGDDLDFAATGLPASLHIDAQTGVIGGTPSVEEKGNYSVQVTARDASNAMASATFVLTVKHDSTFTDGFED